MRPISVRDVAKFLVTTAIVILSACGGDDSPELHKVGGTVTGLSGTGLALQINSADNLNVSADGSFTFPKGVTRGAAYAVTVKAQPTQPPQTCKVVNGEGKIGAADVTNVAVRCTLASARFAFVSNFDDLTISVFTIDSTSGSLTPVPGSPFATGAQQLYALSISPSGKFLIAADGIASTLLVFGVDPSSGALTQVAGSPFATELGAGTSGASFDKSGTHLYAANYLTNDVSAFSFNTSTGALTAVAGSPFAGSDGATAIVVDPSGKFALVADFTGNAVSVYSIDATSGALTPVSGSPFSTGTLDSPTDIDFGSEGKFVYATNLATNPDEMSYNYDGSHLSASSLNPSTGELVALPGSPFAIPENGFIAANQPGSFIYIPNLNNLAVYSIDPASGTLTQVTGSPYPLSIDTSEVTVERSGKFVYLTDSTDSTVTGYAISADTGALTVIPGMPIPAGAGAYNIVTY